MARKYVSTMEQRRQDARRNILDSAVELFFTKGYEKTTTRDIIVKAGILNGSLYNRFRSKEDILYNIVEEALTDALDQLTELLEKERNPVVVINLPGALEIFLASRNRNLAELIYEVHRSWPTMTEFVGTYMKWANEHLRKYDISYGDDPLSEIKLMSVLGAIGNICGYYANGGDKDYREILTSFVGIVCGMFNAHVFDTAKLVDTICGILENGDLTLYGHRLSDA